MTVAKLVALWRGLLAEHPTRVVLGGGALAAVAVALVFLANYPTHDGYRVLVRGIRMKGDVKAITNELEKQGVPYLLSDGGRTVSVPEGVFESASRQINKERLYPRTHEQDLHDMMDKSGSLTMLPDMQRLQRQRLEEVEIARTISMYDSVEFARVHISQPQQTMFHDHDAPVTASIFLELAPGRKLGGDQVAAIKSLVSHSVEGLSPMNITLCDSQGTDYSSCATPTTSAPVATSTVRELELAQLVETVVLGKVTDHLRRLFEPDTFAASVTADLETTQVSVRPQLPPAQPPGQVRQAALTRDDESQDGARPTVLAGPDVITAQLKNVETRGRIRRLSISVLIDSHSLPHGQLDPALRATVDEGIKAAVGFRPQRGDTLSVLVAPFIHHPCAAEAAKPAPPVLMAMPSQTPARAADGSKEDPALRVGARAAAAVRSVGRQLTPDNRASSALTFVAQNFNVLWMSQVTILIFMLMLLVRQLGGAGSGVRGEGHGMYPVRLDQLLTNATACTKGRKATARCLESLLGKSERDIEGALAQCDDETLVLILRAGAESLRRALLAKLPQERARELTERTAAHGPVALGPVEHAQVRLADLLVEATPKGVRSRA